MQILLDALRVIHAWYFCLTCLGIELEFQNDHPPRSALRMRHCVQTFQRLLPRKPFKNIRRILACSCIAVDCAIVLGRQTGCKRFVHSRRSGRPAKCTSVKLTNWHRAWPSPKASNKFPLQMLVPSCVSFGQLPFEMPDRPYRIFNGSSAHDAQLLNNFGRGSSSCPDAARASASMLSSSMVLAAPLWNKRIFATKACATSQLFNNLRIL